MQLPGSRMTVKAQGRRAESSWGRGRALAAGGAGGSIPVTGVTVAEKPRGPAPPRLLHSCPHPPGRRDPPSHTGQPYASFSCSLSPVGCHVFSSPLLSLSHPQPSAFRGECVCGQRAYEQLGLTGSQSAAATNPSPAQDAWAQAPLLPRAARCGPLPTPDRGPGPEHTDRKSVV